EGVYLEPAVQRRSFLLESRSVARPGDLAVDPEPVLFVRRRQLPHVPTGGSAQARLVLEGVVDLQELVIRRGPVGLELQPDGAEALVEGVEHVVALLVNTWHGRHRVLRRAIPARSRTQLLCQPRAGPLAIAGTNV